MAKTHLAELLDEVERGATIVITRHGKPIARLVPEDDRRQHEIDRAMAEIEAARRKVKPMSLEEIIAAKNAGRR